jgi:5-methylcytosine-specific restriction endonuclease McrA
LTRTRQCEQCGSEFSYEIGRGKDRKVCSEQCGSLRRSEQIKARQSKCVQCSTPECSGRATRKSYGLCEACYYQRRRTGSTKRQPARYTYQRKDGYVMVKSPDHPLSTRDGWVFEHRKVAFDLRSGVVGPCHWCGNLLTWRSAVIDHLNEDRADNSEDNLVITCSRCNRIRGSLLSLLDSLLPERFEQFVSICESRVLRYKG